MKLVVREFISVVNEFEHNINVNLLVCFRPIKFLVFEEIFDYSNLPLTLQDSGKIIKSHGWKVLFSLLYVFVYKCRSYINTFRCKCYKNKTWYCEKINWRSDCLKRKWVPIPALFKHFHWNCLKNITMFTRCRIE